MNHSDFNFRKPLSNNKTDVAKNLRRINRISSGDFSPLAESAQHRVLTEEDEQKGLMAWLATATAVIIGVTAFFAAVAGIYNAVKDWFAGRRELKKEMERMKRMKETDRGAKEFFDWLPKSKTFPEMQKILKQVQASGDDRIFDTKKKEVTDRFLQEVKQSNLSPQAIEFLSRELDIKPEYLKSAIKYGSGSAMLSGISGRRMQMSPDLVGEQKLDEKSPPSGPARKFSKDPEVKAAFKKKYGERWKEVMYATAWKMHNK